MCEAATATMRRFARPCLPGIRKICLLDWPPSVALSPPFRLTSCCIDVSDISAELASGFVELLPKPGLAGEEKN